MDDLQDLQGTWLAVWLAQNGRKIIPEQVRRTSVTVSGNRYTLHLGDDHRSGTIDRIHRIRNRGSVDFIADGAQAAGKRYLGIFVLEDDELSVCVAPAGRERPLSFARRPGSGHSLYLLKRFVPSRIRTVEEAVC
jgi:uncharacterized protein (TIGR03067 family)